MTNISKQRLKQDKMESIFDQMYLVLSRLTRSSAPPFLDELLGPEEKIMLAKRLAGIILCIEGKTPYRIWKTLNVSPATAERLYDKYERGDYDAIEKLLTKNQASFDKICRTLEFILRGGLPPRTGRDRASYMFKMRPSARLTRGK